MSTPSARKVRRPLVADLLAAQEVVSRHLAPTPVIDGDARSGLLLKLESMQPTGSFKVRGALNALTAAPENARVITASAGNHGLGVAWAGAITGRHTTVVTSRHASPAKIDALKRLEANLIQIGDSFDEAEQHATELAAVGGHYLSAYNDPLVIAGQGTIGLELDAQVSGPITVVASIGGGGLAGGLGLWASQRADATVIGVEAERSQAVSAAVRTGSYADVPIGETLADGMAGNIEDGSVTVDLIREHVAELCIVTEDEIRMAIATLATRHGVVAEAAGAASFAAVQAGKIRPTGRTICVISGRNIAAPVLLDILASGSTPIGARPQPW